MKNSFIASELTLRGCSYFDSFNRESSGVTGLALAKQWH